MHVGSRQTNHSAFFSNELNEGPPLFSSNLLTENQHLIYKVDQLTKDRFKLIEKIEAQSQEFKEISEASVHILQVQQETENLHQEIKNKLILLADEQNELEKNRQVIEKKHQEAQALIVWTNEQISRIQLLEKNLKELDQKANDLSLKKEEVEAVNRELKENSFKLKTQVDLLNSASCFLKQKLQNAHLDYEKIKAALEISEKKVAAFEEDNSLLKELLQNLNNQMQEISLKKKELDKELDRLKSDFMIKSFYHQENQQQLYPLLVIMLAILILPSFAKKGWNSSEFLKLISLFAVAIFAYFGLKFYHFRQMNQFISNYLIAYPQSCLKHATDAAICYYQTKFIC